MGWWQVGVCTSGGLTKTKLILKSIQVAVVDGVEVGKTIHLGTL